MTQTVAPETSAVAHRPEAPVPAVEAPASPPQGGGTPRVTLRSRLSRLLDFHPAVGVADIVFPGQPRDRRR